jgi:hypothetical protein
MPTSGLTFGSKRAAELAGITYRQLDHWSTTGVIPRQSGGPGSRRRWSFDEVVLMALVGVVSVSSAVMKLDHVRTHHEWLLDQIEGGASVIAWTGGMWIGLDGDPEAVVDLVLEQGAVSMAVFNLDELRDRVEGRGLMAAPRSSFGLAAS